MRTDSTSDPITLSDTANGSRRRRPGRPEQTLLVGGANSKTGPGRARLDGSDRSRPRASSAPWTWPAFKWRGAAPTVLRLASGGDPRRRRLRRRRRASAHDRVVLRGRADARPRALASSWPARARAFVALRAPGRPGRGRRACRARRPDSRTSGSSTPTGRSRRPRRLAGPSDAAPCSSAERAARRCCGRGTGGCSGSPTPAAFGALGELDAAAAHPSAATASPGPGLAMWLDDATAPALSALRFDTRSAYSALEGPLLVGSASDDRARSAWPHPASTSFDASTGLELGPGASAFVTDRTYTAASVDVDAPTGEPALVVLRDELGARARGGRRCMRRRARDRGTRLLAPRGAARRRRCVGRGGRRRKACALSGVRAGCAAVGRACGRRGATSRSVVQQLAGPTARRP